MTNSINQDTVKTQVQPPRIMKKMPITTSLYNSSIIQDIFSQKTITSQQDFINEYNNASKEHGLTITQSTVSKLFKAHGVKKINGEYVYPHRVNESQRKLSEHLHFHQCEVSELTNISKNPTYMSYVYVPENTEHQIASLIYDAFNHVGLEIVIPGIRCVILMNDKDYILNRITADLKKFSNKDYSFNPLDV